MDVLSLVDSAAATGPWGFWAGACVMGVLGSVHCMAMCSPLVCAACANPSPCRGAHPSEPLRRAPLVLYALARIFSYATVGLGSGMLGFAALRYANSLPTRVGLTVLVCGACLMASSPRILQGWMRPLVQRLPAGLVLVAGGGAGGLLGLMTPLLPCGLLWSAALVAAQSGSPWSGALFMVFFGLGSLPGVVVAPVLMGRLRGRWMRAWPVVQGTLLAAAFALVLWRVWTPSPGGLPCH